MPDGGIPTPDAPGLPSDGKANANAPGWRGCWQRRLRGRGWAVMFRMFSGVPGPAGGGGFMLSKYLMSE